MHRRDRCAFVHIACANIRVFGWSVPSKHWPTSGLSGCKQSSRRTVYRVPRGVDRKRHRVASSVSRPSLFAKHACSPTPNTRLCVERLQLSPLSREEHETLDPHRCCSLRCPGRLRQGRAAEAGSSRSGSPGCCAGTGTGARAGTRCSPGPGPGPGQRPGSGFPVGRPWRRPGSDARRGRSQGRTEEVTVAHPVTRGALKKPAAWPVFSCLSFLVWPRGRAKRRPMRFRRRLQKPHASRGLPRSPR